MVFSDENYYHVYNRGVEKRRIFLDKWDFIRFLRGMREFNNNLGDVQRDYMKRKGDRNSDFGYPKSDFLPLVEIISYSLLPNHYHFLLRQLKEGGITLFMKKLGTGYTNYFNHKNKRSSVLFQGKFKSEEVKNYSHFLKLIAYVNCNYEIHKLGKSENWIWSSYLDYIGKRGGTLCKKDIILKEFDNKEEYKKFCDFIIKESQNYKDELRDCL